MAQALASREELNELEEHLIKALNFEYKVKQFRLYATSAIHRHSPDPLKTPRELLLLYQLLLEVKSAHHLRRVVKFAEKLSLAEKYPWLKPIKAEAEKLMREHEELEDEELELRIKELL